MRGLVCLEARGDMRFVEWLQRCWERGDAVFPLDPRLPSAGRDRLLREVRPTSIVDAGGSEHALSDGRGCEEDDALVLVTSGTTGEPKGVVLTHSAVLASAVATSARLGVDNESDRWLACLPLAHIGGLSVLTRAILTGTPFEVADGFGAEDVALAARRRGATLVSLVVTTFHRLGDDATAFRRIVLGGSAPPESLPPNVVTTYGMTETGSGVVYDGAPLDGVEVRIGEAGEILLRGPMLMRGYRDGSSPFVDGDWLPTGDAGRVAEDGRLQVEGRLRDLVISGGENVWPTQVEAVLARHHGIADVAVTGEPDPEWGERVVALVVARDDPPRLGDLRELVKQELGPWAAPRRLVLVDNLPRTASGKLRRLELGALASRTERSED
ncbi:MAG TPA: fatty acid--CoA ligase family protein [Acidimicrobiales bacterium]|nr:fatty acid--CoA ligase family protein [Acidimicrobiales bacterium]